jgi:hypothetical protein
MTDQIGNRWVVVQAKTQFHSRASRLFKGQSWENPDLAWVAAVKELRVDKHLLSRTGVRVEVWKGIEYQGELS